MDWQCLKCHKTRPEVEPYRPPKRKMSKCRTCILEEKRQQNWLSGFSERNILYAPREPALTGTSWDVALSNRLISRPLV